jgi:hypothetical protein
MSRSIRAILGAAVLTVAVTASAQAAEVIPSGQQVQIHDGNAANNRLIIESPSPSELRIVDQVPITSASAACVNVTPLEMRCARPSFSPFTGLLVTAGGGNDQLRMGSPLPTNYKGGSGDDTYFGARLATVPTKVHFEGESGNDFVDYRSATEGVIVTKDEFARDGRSILGDDDRIDDDVEGITGSRHGDTLVGGPKNETIIGGLGDDHIQGRAGNDVIDMGASRDGADLVIGELSLVSFDKVTYAKRTQPIRAAVNLGGADDGEAGEGDELRTIATVLGGSGNDVMVASDLHSMQYNGGPGADTIGGTNGPDSLFGGPGIDLISAKAGADFIFAQDGERDSIFCGESASGEDRAFVDAAGEATIQSCEVVNPGVGALGLAPKALAAEAGETAKLRLSWTHPQSWTKLRKVTLRLRLREKVVGSVAIRPRSERVSDRGVVDVVRKHTRLTRKGKTVTARLALRLDDSLAGQKLTAEVEAVDVRGRRQLERDAGTVRVAR